MAAGSDSRPSFETPSLARAPQHEGGVVERFTSSPLSSRAIVAQPLEQGLPPFAVTPQEDRVGKAVTRHMLIRHAVPAAMGHGHTCLSADRLECDLDLRVLAGPEGGLTPAE